MSFQKIFPFVICICLVSLSSDPINSTERIEQENEEKLSRELILALHRKDRSRWEAILDKQIRQNSQSPAIGMAVCTAIDLEYIEFLEYFLKKGGDIRQSLIPLVGDPERHIISSKKEKVFEYLLSRNLLVLTPNSPIEKIELNTAMEPSLYERKMMEASNKSDLLYQAVIHGTDRMVELLLEKGYDPNQMDALGSHTALFISIEQKNNFNKTKLLLEYTADPNKMADRHTIFRDIDYQFKNDRRTLDLLIQYGLKLDDDDMTLVMRGIDRANIPFLEYLIAHKVPIDPKPLNRKVSPLHRAMILHKDKSNVLVSFLLRNGYDPKEVYRNGSTPLHLAVNHCNLQTIQLFLARGLSSHAVNQGGYTPLDYAEKRPKILEILKSRKTNL